MEKKIKPISRIVKIEAEINKIRGKIFSQEKKIPGLSERWVPCIDVSENENEIVIEVEVPGIKQKDIIILLHSNRIEIKGLKKEPYQQERIKYIQLERQFGPFRRFIFLPAEIVIKGAKASLENGNLTIIMKKSKQKRRKGVVLKIQRNTE